MKKILLIVQREYSSRVTNKAFILMSLLGPLFFAALIILPAWLTQNSAETKTIDVYDDSGLFVGKLQNTEKLRFEFVSGGIEKAKGGFQQNPHDGLLYIPAIPDVQNPAGIRLFTHANLSFMLIKDIKGILKKEFEQLRMEKNGVDDALMQRIKADIPLETIQLGDEGETGSSTDTVAIVSYASAFMIYFFIFYFSMQVMRGVMEEKTNRIMEVLISSVKPYELMAGKIIGIAGVAFTQFAIWVTLSVIVISVLGAIMPADMLQAPGAAGGMSVSPEQAEMQKQMVAGGIMQGMADINLWAIGAVFIYYFIFGYLIYGAMMGAIGAAVDADTDSQQFVFPITIPLILAMITLAGVISDPDSSMSFWLSMIPLTSPISMVARFPFIGAGWELFLSMAILFAAFVGVTWFAGRIYRVGVLMYGKKPTYKDMFKWVFSNR